MPKKRRDSGLYQKQITTGKKADGTYIRKTVYAKTKKELDDKVTEATEGIKMSFGFNAGNTTFAALTEVWLTNQGAGMTEKWMYKMRKLIEKHLLPSFGYRRSRI